MHNVSFLCLVLIVIGCLVTDTWFVLCNNGWVFSLLLRCLNERSWCKDPLKFWYLVCINWSVGCFVVWEKYWFKWKLCFIYWKGNFDWCIFIWYDDMYLSNILGVYLWRKLSMLETTYEQKWLYMLSLKLHFVKTQKFSFTTLIEIIFFRTVIVCGIFWTFNIVWWAKGTWNICHKFWRKRHCWFWMIQCQKYIFKQVFA